MLTAAISVITMAIPILLLFMASIVV